MDTIFTRRSIRQYTQQPVDREDIEKILKAGMQAPTACNDKQWQFYVITRQETREQLASVSPYAGPAAHAPADLVVCYEKGAGTAPAYIDINMAIVCENMMLEAESLGLGTVMLGIAPDPERMQKVAAVLQLPETIAPFAILPVGWPANVGPVKDKVDMDRVHWEH